MSGLTESCELYRPLNVTLSVIGRYNDSDGDFFNIERHINEKLDMTKYGFVLAINVCQEYLYNVRKL